LLATLLIVPSTGVGATLMALGLSVLALFAMTRLSNRLIGGQTGDVAGAVQQLCEIAFLMGVLIYARPH
ncbi:adenosylcobinamide-GDP ribazoletransferase, partial [Azorhizobium caulinodans]